MNVITVSHATQTHIITCLFSEKAILLQYGMVNVLYLYIIIIIIIVPKDALENISGRSTRSAVILHVITVSVCIIPVKMG